jgi:hypothetical protein
MLGQKLGEEHGRVTGRRVLPGDDYRYVKMEVSFEAEGHFFGKDTMHLGTFTVFERIPGQLFGEGRGIWMAKDGSASTIWSGQGVGTPTEGGGVKIAAAISFQAGDDLFAPLARCLVLVEHETRGDGTVHSNLYEWTA